MRSFKPNHWSILVGLILGAIAGIASHEIADRSQVFSGWLTFTTDTIAYPIGQIFLRLLFLVVVPLVFASLAAGVARLGDLSKLGRIGFRTLAFFLLTTSFSVVLGLGAMNLFRPGSGFNPETRADLMETFAQDSSKLAEKATAQEVETTIMRVNQILDMFLPRNIIGAITQMQMLPLIVFGILFGIALSVQSPRRRDEMTTWLDTISDAMVTIVGFAMRIAPYAVFCLIFVVMSRFGAQLLVKLSFYVMIVIGCYLIQIFVLYPTLLRICAKRNPIDFLRRSIPIMVTAFSTSSSNATLPTSIQVSQQDLGIRPTVAGFVLPLGATINMNGTALFEGCVVLFVAQVFGIELSVAKQVLVLVLCVVSSIGVAGVPGGSLPLLMIVMAQVEVPAAGIAIVLGVDRLLDMGRTVVNVMGDIVTAACIESAEQRADLRAEFRQN
ncbi:MAG: dicarboxylate/amino acid:cation symporter [Planctomycetota bacterium]|nr:dicarboxylate/amino acid:cation symporter [Planctomycetota bacterium]